MKPIVRSVVLFFVAATALALVGCSPAAKKARYLKQAEQSFQNGRYDEAEIHYKNVMKIEPQNAEAIGHLGIIYAEQGRIGHAIPLILKAAELLPQDLELQTKLAQINLSVGNLKDARAAASFVLERQPQNEEVPLILAAAATNPAEISNLKSRLRNLPPSAKDGPAVLTALSLLELRSGDTAAAQELLAKALTANPKFAAAHAGLGSILWAQNKLEEASKAYRLAAENSPARSPRRLQFAQFKIQNGDLAAGKQFLEEQTKTSPDWLMPWTLLAEVALLEKNYEACSQYLDKVSTRDPLLLEGMLARGRLALARGTPEKAVEEFERLLKNYPRIAPAHLQLGLAYLATGNTARASASLRQALVLAPSNIEATMALANVYLRSGDPASALALLRPVVSKQPRLLQPRLLLAEGYRQQRNFDEALQVYRQIETDFPGSPQTSFLTGLVFFQNKQLTDARRAFAQALERSPGFLPALERIVALDVVEQKFDAAFQRVETELARDPSSSRTRFLLAKLLLAKNEPARAIEELRKTINAEPDNAEAAFLLAQLYLRNNEDQKAIENLNSLVAKNDRDLGAWLLLAQIREQRQEYAAARDAYEKAIALNPRLGSALNNVAVIYSEHLNDPAKAQAAAQKARELMPQEPHTADTLAWILVKKGQYRWALSLLEESAAKLPDSAVIHYHLGMARYMTGAEEPARVALQAAIDLNPNFPEGDDARLRLALLSLDPVANPEQDRAILDKVLSNYPNDPVALSKLAALQQREGSVEKAIATLRKSAAANSGVAAPLVSLGRLYADQNDTAKALECAKAARKIDPDNPRTAGALGRIAFEAGDHLWAASLLQEAAQNLPNDPALLYDAGMALYSVGRIEEATAVFQSASESDIPNKSQEATSLSCRKALALLAVAKAPSLADRDRVQQSLSTDPQFAPALMAQAALDELEGNPAAARAAYEKVVARFPDFTPAKIRIAILAAAQPGLDSKALELAQQARAGQPDNVDLARALGIMLQRKGGDANRAITLLKQAAIARPNDAELFYNLALAQLQARDKAAARLSLTKAVSAGLAPDAANELRRNIDALK
ncbi:MAG: tetratricopeptide repeat protein [Nibricoccus sp.]